jgi:ribose transport system substrate-binding protein
MMFTRFLLSVCFASTIIFVSTTTAQESDANECPLDDGTLDIAWVPKSLDNPVFTIAQIGAETQAAEMNSDEAILCDIFVEALAPMTSDPADQQDLLNAIVDSGEFDAIGVSCIDPEFCLEPINYAVEQGMDVMTWDADSPDSNRFTYYGVNNYEGGRAAADLLVREMGEEGTVAILGGVPTSFNLNERIRGFIDAIEENYPNITILETVYGNDVVSESVDVVEALMADETYSVIEDGELVETEITGWFFSGFWPISVGRGAMPLWEQATLEQGMKTVSFDALPVQLDFMEEGLLHGLVGQKVWGHGSETIQMIYDYVVLDKEFESITDSGMDLVTTQNVEAMQAAWENNDFSQPMPSPFEEEPDAED